MCEYCNTCIDFDMLGCKLFSKYVHFHLAVSEIVFIHKKNNSRLAIFFPFAIKTQQAKKASGLSIPWFFLPEYTRFTILLVFKWNFNYDAILSRKLVASNADVLRARHAPPPPLGKWP